ncbi:phage tail sheath C-terminal domain-containing protein, partial [Tistlia consotensis]
EAKLADNFGPLKMIDGHAWAAASGTHAELGTLGDGRNSPHLTIMGAKGSPTPPWEWASVLASVAAYYLSIDPARPLQTLTLPGLLAPLVEDRFTYAERDLLLFDGISTFRVDSGGAVVVERAITTYKTNAFGAADASFLDVTTLKTLTLLRFDLRNLIALRFPRHKLANDGTVFSRGQAVVTPRVIRSEIVARFRQWEEQGLAEDVDQFKADLIVERDANDPNRVNALVPPNIVNQLRVFAGQIQFRL